MKEREKQCSIPAYDAHYILERKKRDGVKYPCNPCYGPYASNSPSSNPSRTSHPLWLQQIHVPNVCFQLQKTTDPPNPTQMSASEGSKQPCKCTISYNIVQYFSFLAVVVMWFRLAGCLWRSAFILHTHFSLISGDI